MVLLYDSYDQEPADVFEPMDEDEVSFFYGLETDTVTDDLTFYEKNLPPVGRILELGCGTGRLLNRLARPGRKMVGLDISLPMLRRARKEAGEQTHCILADMTRPPFRGVFDAIIIPRNSLNLLTNRQALCDCLQSCTRILRLNGVLLLQLWIPNRTHVTTSHRTFQFQIFDLPFGGKVVKETLRQLEPGGRTMDIEERFRIRPSESSPKTTDTMHPLCAVRRDIHNRFSILAEPVNFWHSLFLRAGFQIRECYGSYSLNAFSSESTTFLARLTRTR